MLAHLQHPDQLERQSRRHAVPAVGVQRRDQTLSQNRDPTPAEQRLCADPFPDACVTTLPVYDRVWRVMTAPRWSIGLLCSCCRMVRHRIISQHVRGGARSPTGGGEMKVPA